MGPSERAEHVVNAENTYKERLTGHVKALEKLEADYGFDLDVITDIYGLRVLEPEYGTKVLADWQRFFEAITMHSSDALIIASQSRQLEPGCYGFGQTPRYDVFTDLQVVVDAIIENIEYKKGDDSQRSRILITGHCISQPINPHRPHFQYNEQLISDHIVLAEATPPLSELLLQPNFQGNIGQEGTDFIFDEDFPRPKWDDIPTNLDRESFFAAYQILAHRLQNRVS